MSSDQGPAQRPSDAGVQAVAVDEVDESRVPTAPLKAVAPPASGRKPLPVLMDDDDDEDERNLRRVGTKENPFTESIHPRVQLDPQTRKLVEERAARLRPSPAMVALRVLLLLAVLAGLAAGLAKLANG